MSVMISPRVALDASLDVVSSKPAACGVVTYQTPIPVEHYARLDSIEALSAEVVCRMLVNRTETSSKFYKKIPCVIAKSLSSKYQRNLKCKSVTRLCLPICGDKGKQVKLVEGGIRIPALFKKVVIACQFPLPVSGFIRQVEFRKRSGRWLMSYTYNTTCVAMLKPVGVVGVDRNNVGNIVAMVSASSGKVRMLGFNADRWKDNFRRRKARVMSQGRRRLASRLRRKQSFRTRNENHRVSKGIVAFAASQNCAVALEDLKLTKGAKRYADKRQWAHAQLLGFIQYKAVLRGVPVVSVPAAYTSQDCSRCGQRNKADGKQYVCAHCGFQCHRDINAAWNIAASGAALIGVGVFQASSRRALLTTLNLGSVEDK